MSANFVNRLFYGDNLEVLSEHIPADSVDLVYLDPPFNSNRSYNVIFGNQHGSTDDAAAQIQAFDDTWQWTPATDQQYHQWTAGGLPTRAADALTAFRTLLGENDAMAYLVNMAPRLAKLHRVLKPTGSLYLHCDPTMSHYLKVLLDAIFGAAMFRNEIIWKRSHGHNSAHRFGASHDVILLYGKTQAVRWNPVYQPYDESYLSKHYKHVDADGRRYKRENPAGPGTRRGATGEPWRGIDPTAKGRHWARPPSELDILDAAGRIYWPDKPGSWPYIKLYLDEMPGAPLQDVWTDIDPINMIARERLGYPTQKPVALLERIITASSDPGDIVLDPFCGCGTTIDAAQRLGRKWLGIDITFIAIDLIDKRLRDRYPGSQKSYQILGIPRDVGGARALFRHSPFDFERWAVSLVSAQPNVRQVGDKGMDGVARFYLDKKTVGRALISVKGGKAVSPHAVRDLIGTVDTQKAQLGVLITMAEPSPGVLDAVNHGGTYTWPINGRTFPRIQVITIRELLQGKRPDLPTLMLPYIQAAKAPAIATQTAFDDVAADAL